jgi:hypothetical protein
VRLSQVQEREIVSGYYKDIPQDIVKIEKKREPLQAPPM